MKTLKRTSLVVILAVVVVMLTAAAAQASVRIYDGKGVGKARLGMVDRTAASYLGSHIGPNVDRRYPKIVVYVTWFGKKLGTNRYVLEMLSNSAHKVTMFTANTSLYVTNRGVKVGSTESFLKSKYGSSLKLHSTSVYREYKYGSHPYTLFRVKKSTAKVFQIVVGK